MFEKFVLIFLWGIIDLEVIPAHLLHFTFCQAPSGCVPVSQCQTSIALFGQISYCGFGFNLPKICCFPQDVATSTTSTTPTSAPRRVRTNEELTNHKNLDFLPVDNCGVISSRLRIVSGSSTSPGEFPWMALIAYRTGNSSSEEHFKCAGTLINEKFILTAAHCIDNLNILGVRLGEYNLLTEIDCDSNGQHCEPPVQDLLISKTEIYPFYDPSNFINDIGLIELATPVSSTNDNIKPICLPYGDLKLNFDDEELTVAGWGVTENGQKSTTLRKVTVPIVPTEECQEMYGNIKPITKKQICAGAEHGRDACAGDSGGPLKKIVFLNSTPRWVQYGIVSYGPTKCGLSKRPGIYTNVQKYMKWILDNLG